MDIDVMKIYDSLQKEGANAVWDYLLTSVEPDTLYSICESVYVFLSAKDSLAVDVLKKVLGVTDVKLENLASFLAIAKTIRSANG